MKCFGRLIGLLVLALAGRVWGADAASFVGRPDAWFGTEEGKRVVDNIMTWQGKGVGGVMGWPKAYDATKARPQTAAGTAVQGQEWEGITTIDNGATYSELRILARAVSLEKEEARQGKLKESFNKGLDAMLAGQYANGGWPQRFPPDARSQAVYAKHITFNDNAMVRLMGVMKEAGAGGGPFAFVDVERRKKAAAAFDAGIECILKCQIVVKGADGREVLTAWCAQHDEVTLRPAGARAYELASISGSEGGEVAILLMHQEMPNERIRRAVDGAAAWFEKAKIVGKRVDTVSGPEGRDRVLVDAPGSVIWARFYDVETGKPIFCGRDGVKKDTLAEIERERRSGYAWYGNWGEKVAGEYAAWKKRLGD